MNIADIIAILIVISLILWGARKGFVKTIFSLGSLLLSLVLALSLYPAVTDFLSDSAVGDYVKINVYTVLGVDESEAPQQPESDSILNLPQSLFGGAVQQAEATARETLANGIAEFALKLLGILIVFILVKVILWLVLKIFDAFTRLPVIRTANKLLGGVTGAVYGVLVIYLILALLTFTTTLQATNKPIELVLESTYVSTMYHNNILLNFLK